MCFRLIDAKKAQHPVSLLCSVLGVSRAGYYAWKDRPACARRRRDEELLGDIRAIHDESKGTYGWPRIHAELRHRGVRVSRKREQASMEPLVSAFEAFWDIAFPSPQRERLLDNDPLALHAAWSAAMAEGAISSDPGRWQVPCLIFIGAADADFLEGARRAAERRLD
jgi:HTH-like domain